MRMIVTVTVPIEIEVSATQDPEDVAQCIASLHQFGTIADAVASALDGADIWHDAIGFGEEHHILGESCDVIWAKPWQ